MRSATQVFGVVMTINAIKHLDRHAEKAGRLPFVDTVLHEPGRRGVAQRVRTNSPAHLGQAQRGLESGLHRLHRPSVPFHEILADDAFCGPPAQMGKQAARQWHRWLALVGRAGAFGQAVEDAVLEIDIGPALAAGSLDSSLRQLRISMRVIDLLPLKIGVKCLPV